MERKRIMPLVQALDYIQTHRLFLHYDSRVGLDVYTAQTKVPITLRRAIIKHRAQLLDALHQGDVSVCPNRDLHRRYWCSSGVCGICQRLEKWMERSSSGREIIKAA